MRGLSRKAGSRKVRPNPSEMDVVTKWVAFERVW